MEIFKTGIYNGYKIKLPSYGKMGGFYGMFSSEGFIYCNDYEQQTYSCNIMEWEEILIHEGDWFSYEDYFDGLSFERW